MYCPCKTQKLKSTFFYFTYYKDEMQVFFFFKCHLVVVILKSEFVI